MIIFEADDPLVLNGTYDREGYEPGERARIAKRRLSSQTKGSAQMAKSKKKGLVPQRSRRGDTPAKRARVSHRVTTHKPNGGLPESREVVPDKIPIVEAMRQAVEALGEVKIDDDLAPSQLRQLAECYDEVTRAQAAFIARSEDAKTAKKSLEGATEFLLARVKEFTHPTALPLFDQAQAEGDRADMLDAADDDGASV